jgi:hypothetical protein
MVANEVQKRLVADKRPSGLNRIAIPQRLLLGYQLQPGGRDPATAAADRHVQQR